MLPQGSHGPQHPGIDKHSLWAAPMGLSSSSLSGPEHHSSPLYGCFRSSTHRRLLRGATSAQAGQRKAGVRVSVQSTCPPTSRPILPDAPPQRVLPRIWWALSQPPWPPPHHHLVLISLPPCCLPSPTQHQAQHNPQPQLVLIRTGGAAATLPGQCLLSSSHQPRYQEVPEMCGSAPHPEHLPLPLWGLWWESRRRLRLTRNPSLCVAPPWVAPKDDKSPPWPTPILREQPGW